MTNKGLCTSRSQQRGALPTTTRLHGELSSRDRDDVAPTSLVTRSSHIAVGERTHYDASRPMPFGKRVVFQDLSTASVERVRGRRHARRTRRRATCRTLRGRLPLRRRLREVRRRQTTPGGWGMERRLSPGLPSSRRPDLCTYIVYTFHVEWWFYGFPRVLLRLKIISRRSSSSMSSN